MAAAAQHGRLWGHAYAVAPSGIYMPPESAVRRASELANVRVAGGYRSGSHFSALQALETFLQPAESNLHFVTSFYKRHALVIRANVLPSANALLAERPAFRLPSQ